MAFEVNSANLTEVAPADSEGAGALSFMDKPAQLSEILELERRLAYNFQTPTLLERALTHRSYANERPDENIQSNEALEFLGDSVLGFIVSSWIFESFPGLDEGRLSKIKAYLVSARTLARRAEALGLGQFLRLNRGEEKTGGRFKRALIVDAYEAIIAAIYLDSGLDSAVKFIRRELFHELKNLNTEDLSATDYKSALQEYLQASNLPAPEYVVIDTAGPEHERVFRIELRVGNERIATGAEHAIKVAHQEAAREALTKLRLIGGTSVLVVQTKENNHEVQEIQELPESSETSEEQETPEEQEIQEIPETQQVAEELKDKEQLTD